MKIFNGTPHNIHIVRGGRANPQIRKLVAKEEDLETITSIPPTQMVSAKIEKEIADFMGDIPIQRQKVVDIDPLPEGYDIYIVSAIYAVAARQLGHDTSKLFIIADPVFTEDGRTIIGCQALAPAL